MGTLTMKFGGSSVGNTNALTQVVSIIIQEYERWDHLIVVVSALEGVTDALLEAAHLAQLSNRRGYRRIVATIRTRHLALVEQLSLNNNEHTALQADIDRLLFDMLDTCQSLTEQAIEGGSNQATIDAIVSVGERLATRIIAALIRSSGLRSVAIDTDEILITDTNFGDAKPNLEATQIRYNEYLQPLLERGIVPILTGFIGGTLDGNPTTLGRGGSDYTAAIIGACAATDEVWMWTDVDGLMSTDPREVNTARVITALSYEEVAELAYFGARIVHARMIAPLQSADIPIRIKNVYKPQGAGTLIHHTSEQAGTPIKAVTSIQGIGLTADSNGPLSAVEEAINNAVTQITGNPPGVQIVAQSSNRSFICVVIPPHTGPEAVNNTRMELEAQLAADPAASAWQTQTVGVITAIGSHLNTSGSHLAGIFAALEDIPLLAISQGPSQCHISLVVKIQHASIALERLHALAIADD